MRRKDDIEDDGEGVTALSYGRVRYSRVPGAMAVPRAKSSASMTPLACRAMQGGSQAQGPDVNPPHHEGGTNLLVESFLVLFCVN